MASWPLTLQQFINESGFNLDIGDTSISTTMDVGLDKKRRRYTKGIDMFSVTIDLEKDDYLTLYNFYNDTLNGGVNSFTFDHPLTGVSSDWRFKGAPNVAPKGGLWFRVSMKWELLP